MTLITTRRIALSLIACAFAFAASESAEARPQYNKTFKGLYGDKFEEGTSLKCNVCHGKSKKKLSKYGMDLKEKIGGKNVKDADAVEAALKAVEEMDSQTDDKTYGDLINAGTLPKPFEE